MTTPGVTCLTCIESARFRDFNTYSLLAQIPSSKLPMIIQIMAMAETQED